MKVKLFHRDMMDYHGKYEEDETITSTETNESFESRINEFLENHKCIVVKFISVDLCYAVYREDGNE